MSIHYRKQSVNCLENTYDKRRSIKSYMLTNNITITPPIFRGQAIHKTILYMGSLGVLSLLNFG